MTPALELKGIRKSFNGFQAVSGMDLRVPPGSVFGLLGPNGAGKTTTIRMIMDIIAPDAGEILVGGRPRTPEDLRAIGYLPEERGLYRKMTVQDHLVFLGELHGLSRSRLLPRVESWLERVELAPWGRRKVEELSKGMQQKIQLIGTFLPEPELVILDEPFSGLDPLNQQLFKDLLAEFRAQGKTILLSTHILEQAEKLCDEVCLISGGKAILSGELRALKQQMGGNVYHAVVRGDASRMGALEGVTDIQAKDGEVSLILSDGTRGAGVLRELIQRVEVEEFRAVEPDLEEIFIKAVRGAKS